MNPPSTTADTLPPLRVAFTAAVGSHLDTASHIERALRAQVGSVVCTVVDLVGFSPWDATGTPYAGQCHRVSFDLHAWGIDRSSLNSSTWPTVQRGAIALLEQIRPDLLVTMDDSWYDQHALIVGAKQAGVPTVLVQEGPFLDGITPQRRSRGRLPLSVPALKRSRFVRRLFGKPVSLRLPSYGSGGASVILAASDWYRRRFIESGVPPHRVAVTGVPRYDALPRVRREWLARRRDAQSSQPPRVLLLSQPFVRYGEMSEGDFCRLAAIARGALAESARREGAIVDVRMHPSDRGPDMDVLLGEQLDAALVAPVSPLVETLAFYDVVVGFTSSGLLEAMAAGIPIVAIETPPIAFRTQFFRDVGAPVATDVTAAAELVSRAARSRESLVLPPRLTDEVGILDGMASNRVADRCCRQITA